MEWGGREGKEGGRKQGEKEEGKEEGKEGIRGRREGGKKQAICYSIASTSWDIRTGMF